MSANAVVLGTAKPASNKFGIALWAAQIILAVAFGAAGGLKLSMPVAELARRHSAYGVLPQWLVWLIGAVEIIGATGLIVPAAIRIQPRLTPIAAVALITITVLGLGFQLSLGEVRALPITLILGALAFFVAWGRFKKVPITAR
jgi:putative oxidoreductase